MMRHALLVSAALLSAFFNLSGAQAQERPMRPIGTVTFEPQPMAEERGVFRIRPEERRIRTLSVEADTGEAEIRGLRITYDDGSVERVRVRQRLREGERLEPIRLEDDGGIVTSVEVTYVPRGAVSLVLMAGGGRREPPPPPPPPREEWVELGCKSVSFLADIDKLAVSSGDRYRALRLKANRFDIRVEEMGVRFENGARDVYAIRTVIPANSRTSAIDLRGERRRINQLDFVYSSNVISNNKPQLCVEGLKAGSGF